MRMNLLAIGALSAALYAAPITIYNTGVDNSNTPLAGPVADPHWTLESSPLGAGSAFVVDNANPVFAYWAPNGPTANWIAPTTNAMDFVPAGNYVYTTTFDMTGLIASTGSFSGVFIVDNSVADIRLNGVSLGISGGSFNSPTAFTINCGSNCVATLNTLSFVVNNLAPSPSGIKITISGAADAIPPSGAPEPSTYIMMGAGLGLFALARTGKRLRK